MIFLNNPLLLLTIVLYITVPQINAGSVLPRQLTTLIRQAQGIFRPAGGSRGRVAAMLALMKLSTTTTTTTTPVPSAAMSVQRPDRSGSVSPGAAPPLSMASLLEEIRQQYSSSSAAKTVESNPTDLLGQLAISFDQKGTDDWSGGGSGDLIAQVSGMLPMILSIAKPVMASYKGTDGYGGFMELLRDGKQILSNRNVVRQLNQFLDDLIVGDATGQTPPTPSDSSLNSLAQIAQQNMESLFNVPQTRPRKTKSSSSTSLSSDNEVPTDFSDDSVRR